MIKTLFLVSLFLCLISCDEKKTEKYYDVSNMDTLSLDSVNYLIDLSIIKGDTNSYQKIRNYYFIRGQYPVFLNYSLLMANKNNYSMAFFDVYFILTHSKWGTNLESLDSATRELAITYLRKSYKLNYFEAINEKKELKINW